MEETSLKKELERKKKAKGYKKGRWKKRIKMAKARMGREGEREITKAGKKREGDREKERDRDRERET